MSQRVTGPFEVKVTPQKPDTQIARAASLGRLTIDKRFHGELEAISKGEMLATQTEVKGSAAYVALERVTGTLKGRSGSFVRHRGAGFRHRGTQGTHRKDEHHRRRGRRALLRVRLQVRTAAILKPRPQGAGGGAARSEEHTSELQSHLNLVCR